MDDKINLYRSIEVGYVQPRYYTSKEDDKKSSLPVKNFSAYLKDAEKKYHQDKPR